MVDLSFIKEGLDEALSTKASTRSKLLEGVGPAYQVGRDGQLFPTVAATPAQVFYNYAMLPGWQKWKPIYRHGTLVSIDRENNTASVELEPVASRVQGLDVVREINLSEVEFDYMDCDHLAFSRTDEVLVKFMPKGEMLNRLASLDSAKADLKTVQKELIDLRGSKAVLEIERGVLIDQLGTLMHEWEVLSEEYEELEAEDPQDLEAMADKEQELIDKQAEIDIVTAELNDQAGAVEAKNADIEAKEEEVEQKKAAIKSIVTSIANNMEDFAEPTIIGFKEEPQDCEPRMAFEATDAEGNFKGIVICKGEGFNPPYEFIETAAPQDFDGNVADPLVDGQLCSFYAGGFRFGYDENTGGEIKAWKYFNFESLEHYLIPREIVGTKEGDKETSFMDHGVIGCQNCVSYAATSAPAWGVGHSKAVITDKYVVSENPYHGWFTTYSKRFGTWYQTYCFFVPSDGLNNPIYDRWNRTHPGNNYMHDQRKSGGYPLAEMSGFVYDGGYKSLEDTEEIWHDNFYQDPADVQVGHCIWFFSEAFDLATPDDYEDAVRAKAVKSYPLGFFRYTLGPSNLSYEAESLWSLDYLCWTRKEYQTKMAEAYDSYNISGDSSAIDKNRYVFYNIEQTEDRDSFSPGYADWYITGQKSIGTHPYEYSSWPDGFEKYTGNYSDPIGMFHCSGEHIDITEYTNGQGSFAVRYWEVGDNNKKWHVMSCRDGVGIVFLCYTKEDGEDLVETPPVAFHEPGPQGSLSPKIDGVTDFEGNPLYSNRMFRLII